jgi:hydrogenase expression/formation protein HypE
MVGATPMFLSLSLIIEEGLALSQLKKIIISIKETADRAGVKIITGDTKVVNRGDADNLFINTSGIGIIPEDVKISSNSASVGDKIIISGSIGDHGIALLCQREGMTFESSLVSDCAPLNNLVHEMIAASKEIKCLRDPTRGGLASTLNEFAESSNIGIRIEEEKIPIKETVRAACEIMGLDPFHIANEGKLVAIVSAKEAEKVLDRMRDSEYGKEATIIGEVVTEHPKKVVVKTRLGAYRMLHMPAGEILPRIC